MTTEVGWMAHVNVLAPVPVHKVVFTAQAIVELPHPLNGELEQSAALAKQATPSVAKATPG